MPGGSGATPTGALARTRRQDKNPLDDSTQITRGLEGSYRVHKPEVPRGPASQQRLGPSRQTHNSWAGPSTKMTGQRGDRIFDQEAWPKRNNVRFPILAHLSDWSTRFGLQPTFGRSLLPEGLAKALPPTPTHVSDRGCAKPLLMALLRLARSEPTGTNRPGTPARKILGNERRKQGRAHKSNLNTGDHTLYTYRNSTLQPPWHNSDPNSVVGADIFPTVLWAPLTPIR